jgi:hypothetical protein
MIENHMYLYTRYYTLKWICFQVTFATKTSSAHEPGMAWYERYRNLAHAPLRPHGREWSARLRRVARYTSPCAHAVHTFFCHGIGRVGAIANP